MRKHSFIRDILHIVISALLLIAVRLLTDKVRMPFGWLTTVLFLIPYFYAGYEVIFEAAEKLFRGELLDEDFLMTIASAGAICIGEYTEAVAVMLLYGIGEFFERLAEGKSRQSISELLSIRPDKALMESCGTYVTVHPSCVKVGGVILVRPGERVPLDGVVLQGESTLDTSPLTGESMPRHIKPGSEVYAACVNLSGLLRIRVTSSFKDSAASRLIELVKNASDKKSDRESFITRFARIYTPAVVCIALLLGILPPLIGDTEWAESIHRALVFLVISCPCALVISVPLSFFSGIGCASKNGILIKSSKHIEALADTRVIVMDKTGTVTEGSFSVIGVMPVGADPNELLRLAAAAESFSNHPIALSLRNACDELPDRSLISEVRELPGRGVEASVCGKRVLVGSSTLMESNGIKATTVQKGSTVVHVAADGVYCGYIVIDDRIKEGAKEAVRDLYRLGIEKTVMLTGDNENTAQAAAKALGLNNVYAELLPEDKVIAIKELRAEKHEGRLLFIGDGINDAPVLENADVGVAMGVLGADAAIEAADVVIMDDDMRRLPLAIKISARTLKIAKQNIVISLAVKAAVMVPALLTALPMWLAVFADVGVLIIAVINALRALRYE